MGKKIKDPGFGKSSSQNVKRLIDRKGRFNVVHLNKSRRFSEAYNFLVNISWWKFFTLSFLSYVLANIFFATLYILIGIEQIVPKSGSVVQDFLNAFFFSAQTFTTLGYGAMSPNGISSGVLSSIEAFIGLMFFAFTTGLLYGRFSKPRAAIRFSKHLILRTLKGDRVLMFRIENDRKSTMINPKVAVTLKLTKVNKDEEYINEFYTLKLERDTINYLPTTWTIVHEMDKESPLYKLNDTELLNQQGELIVMVSYYDESFNQVVHQMCSYLLRNVKLNYKFVKAYYYNDEGDMILDHKLFDCIEPIKS